MEDLPPIPEPVQDSVAPPPGTSLMARLLNVFAVPGEVFEEVKVSPFKVGNWLVPALLLALVGALSTMIIFSQPSIQQGLREQQEKALNQQVKAGKVKQEDVDKILDVYFNPTVLKVAGAAFGGVGSVVRVIWWGLMLWLMGRFFLKAQFDFLKGLEVAGLALMIAVLGVIVSLLLTVNLGKLFATPSLALVVSDFDATRKSHLFLGAANLFSVWQMVVMGVGLSKLSGAPFVRAFLLVFIFWCLQESLFILVGAGALALA